MANIQQKVVRRLEARSLKKLYGVEGFVSVINAGYECGPSPPKDCVFQLACSVADQLMCYQDVIDSMSAQTVNGCFAWDFMQFLYGKTLAQQAEWNLFGKPDPATDGGAMTPQVGWLS